jgi:hypothetical protein
MLVATDIVHSDLRKLLPHGAAVIRKFETLHVQLGALLQTLLRQLRALRR